MENDQEKQEIQKLFALLQKNSSYYEAVFRRPSVFKEVVLGFFFSCCSLPRLVLEVFLRRNMGERYFAMGTAIIIAMVTWFYAALLILAGVLLERVWVWTYMSLGLIAFPLVFLYYARQRQQEIDQLPSVFDFKRFSLATGKTLSFFDRYTTDRRKLTTIYEPAAGFIIGFALLFIIQIPLAVMLMTCSITYSLSYLAAYHQGDNFLMDQIDQRICAEDLADTFRLNLPYDQTRGAEFFGYQPEDPAQRQRMAGAFGNDTAHEVI